MKTQPIIKLSLAIAIAVSGTLLWFCMPDGSPGNSTRGKQRHQAAAAPVDGAVQAADVAVPVAAATPPPADFGGWVTEKPRQPDFAKIEAFEGWVGRWKSATPEERAAMTAEGTLLAGERRAEFKALIMTDPQQALARAVPRVVRQDLPEEIVSLLEKPVSATGDFDVYKGRPAPGTPMPEGGMTLRYFEAGGTSYQASVFGAMEPVMSRKQIPLRGVAIDRPLAVAESPLRQLETGERISAGTVVENTCPVSGKTTEAVANNEAVTEDTPTVEVGERVITLCNGSHVSVLDEKYRVFVQAAGPGSAGFFMDAYPGTSSRAIGNFRCLYIRATYPDQMSPPNTEDQAVEDMKNTTRFFLESSYGKMTTTATVTPLVVLPQTLKWYQDKDAEVNGLGVMQTQARESARKLGYDSTQYDCIIIRVNGGLRSGASWGGGDSVWLGWGGMDVINHECGHSLGLGHANYWATTDGTAYGDGANQEYGNGFDVMGGGGGYSAHYNTTAKRNLGWLPNSYMHFPKGDGVFRLYAFDQSQLEEGKRYGLNVTKDSNIQYNIEYHANNPTLANQATVLYGSRLIDTTPGSSGGKNDGGIQIGRTFSDLEADMHFTVLSKNATTPPSLDVAYFRGPFPDNVAPTVALNASATTVAVGTTVTFTATANDANGDALAYQWDFDDGSTAANNAVVAKTFSNAAQVTGMVTVSDMKGGTTRRHVVVNVGSHGKQMVSGNISAAGLPLANVRVSITNGKYAYTDADGNYALAGVPTGTQTLTATLNGYVFTPSFSNPLAVVAGTNTANWTAAGSTFVTLAKTADATEGGTNGSFTLTRTGATDADLIVSVSPAGGTATLTTDYTFSPNYVTDGGYRTFTIPAGQVSLTIAVAAVNDTAQEGPETIALQVASNGNYLQTSANSAVMTLVDNDTTLPQVAVTAPGPYAMEPADAGSFIFTRTGPTTSSLSLPVVWSGTAANGADYATLPATVIIPAGQSSLAVDITPIDDNLIEIPETVIATISSNAAYVRSPVGTTATVTLSDDDTPVVTVTATDAGASEAGPDSGVLLIQRTGSTAAELKVYYGLSGSAFHGTDYARLSGEVTIPAGSSSAPVVITPYDDDLGEGSETVTLAVTTFNNAYSLGAAFQSTITIADNGDVPVISVRAGTTGVEGGANASVIFRSLGSASGNVVVNYTVSGTATAGSDFTALSGTVTLPAAGPFDVSVSIPVINDTLAEPTETVKVIITPGAGYRVYNDASAEAVIQDNDSGQRVMVTAYNSSAAEGSASTGQFYLSRPTTAGGLTVSYALSGTATSGGDYTGLTGTAVIPDTASGVVVAFNPVDDALAEGTETVTLNVVAGSGYGVDRPASATLEIADNDAAAVTVGFLAASGSTSEIPGANGEYRDIPVVLSATSASTVTVQCVGGSGSSAAGDDVDWAFVDAANGNAILPTATVTFAPGATTANLRIRVKNDGVSEGSETAVLELRAPLGASLASGKSKHSLMIFDDAIPNLVTEERWNSTSIYTNQTWTGSSPVYSGFLTSFTPAQGVGDAYSRRLTGQIVAPATGSYTFWVAGDDAARLYLSTTSSAANKVQIASLSAWVDFQAWDTNASQKSANISLVAGQSYYMEVQQREDAGGDHVSVAWQGPGFARKAITVETPDNAPRTLRMAVNATTRMETDGSEPLLMVMLDRPAGATPVTVDYTVGGTATAGSDYLLAPGTLTFVAGEQMKLLPLTLIADAVGETPEAIVVSLANPVGATLVSPASHTITVLDGDAPLVATTQFTATSAMAANTVVGTVAATVAGGRTVSAWSIVAGNEGNLFDISSSGQIRLLLPAQLPNPGTRRLLVRATDSAGATGDGAVNLVCNPPATLGVVEKRWSGSTAYNSQAWTGTTNYSGTLATFTTPQNVADSYSRRLTGYLQPQVSGNYTFWIASDDDSRLFLSTDATAANKVQLATVSGWVDFQSWGTQSSQKSVVVPLEAGKVYWMEVHHLEGGGGDHASVAWSGPGFDRVAIPASALFPSFGSAPAVPMIAVTSPAAGTEYSFGSTVSIDASVVGGSQAITVVEFYGGNTLIASDATAPYSAIWNNAPVGSTALTARAVYSGGSVTSPGVGITVPNSAPVFTVDPIAKAAATEDAPYSGSIAGDAADPDFGDVLVYSKVSGPAWLNVASNGALSGTPANSDVGASGFTVRVTDPVGLSDDAVLNITVANVNDAPVFAANPITGAATTEGSVYGGSLAGSASDVDAGDTLAFSKVSGPAWLNVAANGTLSGIPGNGDVGANSFVVRVTDASNASADAAYNVTVAFLNDAPVFAGNPLDGGSAVAAAAYGGNLAPFASDSDAVHGDTISFSKTSGPTWLTVAANGTLGGTPAPGNLGVNSFVVRVTDAAGLFAETTWKVNVTPVEMVKANNTTALNLAGSWLAGVVPGAGEVAVWNSTVTGSNTVSQGANATWAGLRIDNPGGDVTLNGAFTLAAGAVNTGSTRNLTIATTAAFGLSSLTGSTSLTISRAASNNWTTTFNATDALNFTGTLALRGGNATTSPASMGVHWLASGGPSLTQKAGSAFALDTGAAANNAGDFIVGDAWNGKTLQLSALSGFGTIRTDWGTASATRTVRVNQAADTIFNGLFLAHNSRSLILQKAGTGTLTMAGLIGVQAGTPRVDLAVEGGTLVLAANNSRVNAADATTISSGATLQLGNGGTTGTLGTNNAVADNGTLVFNRSNVLAVGNVISGSGQLRQIGSGTSALSSANTYTGITIITGGKLELTGSLAAASAVTVEAAGTFSGTGSAPGAVTVSGKLAPGISGVGTLATGAVTLADGANLAWDLGGSSDLVNAASLDFSGSPTIHLYLTGTNPAASGQSLTIPLVATTGGISGFANATFVIHAEGLAGESGVFAVQVQGNVLALSIAPGGAALIPWQVWQEQHFGNQAGDSSIAGPTADPDGDGVANRTEMVLGLDPNDTNSRLQLSLTEIQFPGTVTLRISPVVTAGIYVIETADDPGGTWVAGSPVVIGAAATFLDLPVQSSGIHKFFRLRYTPDSP